MGLVKIAPMVKYNQSQKTDSLEKIAWFKNAKTIRYSSIIRVRFAAVANSLPTTKRNVNRKKLRITAANLIKK